MLLIPILVVDTSNTYLQMMHMEADPEQEVTSHSGTRGKGHSWGKWEGYSTLSTVRLWSIWMDAKTTSSSSDPTSNRDPPSYPFVKLLVPQVVITLSCHRRNIFIHMDSLILLEHISHLHMDKKVNHHRRENDDTANDDNMQPTRHSTWHHSPKKIIILPNRFSYLLYSYDLTLRWPIYVFIF